MNPGQWSAVAVPCWRRRAGRARFVLGAAIAGGGALVLLEQACLRWLG